MENADVAGRDPQRPGGKRFGSLVHGLMAETALAEDIAELEAIGRAVARVLDATDADSLAFAGNLVMQAMPRLEAFVTKKKGR